MINFLLPAEKFIERIEKLRINSIALILYFSFLISLRDTLEQLFFEESYSVYQYIHHFFFYSLVLMAGILFMSQIGKIELIKTSLIASAGFILIILPPLVDRFVSSRSNPYDYVLPKEFIKNMATFFLYTQKAGLGILLEIAAILLLASFYIFIKTRSVFRALITGLFLYLMVGISVTPRLYLPVPDMTQLLNWQYRHVIYFCFYFVLSMLLGLFFLYRINKNWPRAIFKELYSFRTLHFILMVGIGIHIRGNLEFFKYPDFLFVLISFALIALLWLKTILINSVYDLPIDKISNPCRPLAKGDVSSIDYLSLSLALSIIVLLVSIILGIIPFIITLVVLLSSLSYSVPPLRLRRKLLSSLFIGWGSSLAFFLGYYNRVRIQEISMSNNALFLAVLIFVALSTGSLTKDLKDYNGDLQNGIKTFFTIYGLEKGKRIVSLLLFLSLLIPLLLFHRVLDVIFFGSASCIITLLFYLKEKLVLAYLGYGTVFFYCALRILGFI
jgi:4-hydroxybenzoate polyprenyltransferase